MYTFIFIVVLSLVTVLNNKAKDIDDSNTDSYKFDKTGALVILGFLGLSIILNLISKFFGNFVLLSLIVYAGLSILALVIVNTLRIQAIEKEREEIKQIYEILSDLLKTKGEINYNDVPFTIIYDKGNKKQIDKIILKIQSSDKITDSAVTQGVYSLNKYLPYRQWVSEVDFPERECRFIGNKLPPSIANYPGSDLRPWNFIPTGVTGVGESGWNLGAKKKNMGQSLYIYEDTGLRAGTAEVSKAPQSLMVGSTGGGKAIWVEELVKVID